MLRPNRFRWNFAVMAGLLFIGRTALVWFIAALAVTALWHIVGFPHIRPLDWLFAVAVIGFVTAKVIHAIAHLRRVQLIKGRIDADALSQRQRRQIEIPFDTAEAFAIVDASIRELPNVNVDESTRDSLNLRAHIEKPVAPKAYVFAGIDFGFLVVRRHQILATLTPANGTSSALLICEAAGGIFSDWLQFDDGSNLENAEALTRAITRRIAERRRGEQASAQQTSTEKELAVAKLNLLHAQIEPHFLYNTLANAQILTRTDPARADEMLGNLIAYLRSSMPRPENAPSTLGEELERSRAYLEILRIRMGDRLKLQIEVPESLKSAAFPAMMLQTLVENAIKHGLEPKYGGGTIWILARENAGQLTVTVADDGQGFNAQSSGTGIGLKNVRERLKLAYGTAASFVIAANFPNGVAATITVPISTDAAATGANHA